MDMYQDTQHVSAVSTLAPKRRDSLYAGKTAEFGQDMLQIHVVYSNVINATHLKFIHQ
jgi:hypothetical protein